MTLPAPTYDLVLLIDPKAEDAARAKIVSDTRSAVEAGGELLRHDDWGERPLSYPIEKKTSAEYHLFQFHAGSPELLNGLDRTLRITDGVLRFRIIKLGPASPTPPRCLPRAHRPSSRRPTAQPPSRRPRSRPRRLQMHPPRHRTPRRQRRRPRRTRAAASRPTSPSLGRPDPRCGRAAAADSGKVPFSIPPIGNKICVMSWAEGHDGDERAMSRTDVLRASPPMFESRVLDSLSRVHPAVPVIIFVPVIVVLAAWGLQTLSILVAVALACRRVCAVDAVRVLAAPRRLPFRTRGRLRRANALDHPRCPPRPPERPHAARDASRRQRPARSDRVRGPVPASWGRTPQPRSAQGSSPDTSCTT